MIQLKAHIQKGSPFRVIDSKGLKTRMYLSAAEIRNDILNVNSNSCRRSGRILTTFY